MACWRGRFGLALAAVLLWNVVAGVAIAARPPAPTGQLPFFWGVTMAAYQNDGAHPTMDWYEWEEQVAAAKGYDRSGKSADFRHNLDADLDRAQSLGLNAFRTSIEWARMEPVEGQYDRAEVAYTHRLLAGLRQRGMTPIITLYHFATPRWLGKDDGAGLVGWESPRSVAAFRRWAAFVAREFGKEIDIYLTFNEPSSILLGGYASGFIPPHRVGPVSLVRATANVLAAHEAAYDALHAGDPGCWVSVPDYNALLPVLGGIDWLPGKFFNEHLGTVNGWDGRPRPRTLDFTAIHYYGINPAFTDFPTSPWKWRGHPEHLKAVVRAYYQAFHLPVLLAENGLATNDGQRDDGWTREAYLVAHIGALKQVQREGVPVMGYCYWTLTDNYEWGSFKPRYGLWRVEAKAGDTRRIETPAVGVYRAIVKAGGVSEALAKRYPAPI